MEKINNKNLIKGLAISIVGMIAGFAVGKLLNNDLGKAIKIILYIIGFIFIFSGIYAWKARKKVILSHPEITDYNKIDKMAAKNISKSQGNIYSRISKK